MPSSYTLNNGIELIDTGEQSGTWGDTTNDNLSFIDTALDGQVTITAPGVGSGGSPNDLPITNGTASNGRNRLVEIYSGTNLGGTVYYQLTPNDAEKIIYIRNSLNTQDLIVFQGTYNASNDYLIPNGKTAVIFFNGTGSGAVAANVMSNAHFDALNIVGNAVVGGILSIADGSNSAPSLTNTGDTNTGLYFPAADEVGITVGGTQVFKADSTGANVTGTLVSDGLTVDGSAASTLEQIALSNNNASFAAGIKISASFDSDDEEYGNITWTPRNGAQGYFQINNLLGGSLVKALEIDGNDITFYDSSGNASFVYDENAGSTFNEQGADRDFRVESDSNTHMLFVDAGNNRVGINAGSTPSSIFHILNNDTVNSILQDTSANGEAYHSYINDVNQWRTGVFNDDTYRVYDITNSESRIQIYAGAEMVINEGGADRDFRVESDDQANMLLVDAGADKVLVNTNLTSTQDVEPSVPAPMSVKNGLFLFRDLSASGNDRNLFNLDTNGSWGATENKGTHTNIRWSNGASNTMGQFGLTYGSSDTVTGANSEFAIQGLYHTGYGNSGVVAAFGANQSTKFMGGVTVNENGNDQDFRVESDTNTHALFVDAGNSRIGFFNDTPSAPLHLKAGSSGGSLSDAFQISDTGYVNIAMYSGGADGEIRIGAAGVLRGSYKAQYAGTRSSNDFHVGVQDTTGMFSIDGAGAALIINERGANTDFRVESDSNTHMLFVDAGSDFVSVGSVNTTLGSGLSVTPTATYGNTVTHRAADIIGGSGQRANMTSGILTIETTSSGNQLTIPVTFSGSFWAQYYVRIVVVSAEYNSSNAKGGEATFTFAEATSISNLSTLSTTGNISSIARVNASSPNPHTLQINFTTPYTSGLNNWEGIQLYYEIVSSWPDRMQMQNAALN